MSLNRGNKKYYTLFTDNMRRGVEAACITENCENQTTDFSLRKTHSRAKKKVFESKAIWHVSEDVYHTEFVSWHGNDFVQTPFQSDSLVQVSLTRSWLCLPQSQERTTLIKIYQWEVCYRLRIWHLDLTNKSSTRWQLPWMVTYHP